MENKKINANSYDLLPAIYDIRGFFILTFAYRNSIFRQLRFFAENMKEKHLECAIGTGSFTKLCLLMKRLIGNKTQTQLVGVDYSEALMGGAKKKLKHCELKIEDLRNLSFPDASFDSVNLPNGFHTIDGIEKVLDETTRVLKPGGSYYVNVLTPPGSGFLNRISKAVNNYGKNIGILNRPYTVEEARQLLESRKLEIISETKVGNCAYFKARKI